MSEYKQYVTSINKIFYDLEKMKTGWNYLDNLNYIDSVEEYKQIVANSADVFKQEKAFTAEKLGDEKDKSVEDLEGDKNDRETNI